MRLKKNLMLRKVAGEYIVVPIGKLSKISPMMQVTSSTAWLWEQMKDSDFTEDSLVELVLGHFTCVDEPRARADIQGFLKLLDENYMLDNGRPEPMLGSVQVQVPREVKDRLGGAQDT